MSPKAFSPKAWHGKWPVFLYLYKVPRTGELLWVFGYNVPECGLVVPEGVNDPRVGNDNVFFDSSPSAKGGCALNGPASPECKWRECRAGCPAYPKKGVWYAASATNCFERLA